MYCSVLSTWTILLLAIILLKCVSLGLPISNKNENVPKSMYEAIIKKCPAVEETNLKNDSIVTRECSNWLNISSISTFTDETKEGVKCLLYYESMVSFCTAMGSDLTKTYNSLFAFDFSKNNFENICSNIYKFVLSNTTEHKLSRLIPSDLDCLRLCFNGNSFDKICLSAFYYNSLNVSKLKTHRDNLLKSDVHVSNQTKINSTDTSNIPIEQSEDNVALPNKAEQTKKVKGEAREASDTKKTISPEKSKPPELSNISEIEQKMNNNNGDNKKNEETKKVKSEETLNIEENVQNPLDAEDGAGEMQQEDSQDQLEDEDNGPEHDHVDIVENNAEVNSQRKNVKPNTVEDESINSFNTSEDEMDGDSYFFSYFTVLMCLCIAGYVGYHNRHKILALILEGKKGRRSSRSRRPNSANYHKLDSNLEEAISSSCPKGSTNIMY